MILKFIENDGVTGARLTIGERPIPDGSFLYRDGRYIRGGELGTIPAFATHRHAGDTLKHVGVNSSSAAFSFATAGPVTFSQLINAASGSKFGNLTLADGSITDSSGAIDFGNENLSTIGTIQSAAIGCGIAPDSSIIGKFYRDDSSTDPQVLIEQDGSGDASLRFLYTGGNSYTMGIDNSESLDQFKISPGAFSNTDYFTMNPTGQIGIGRIPQTTYALHILTSPTDTSYNPLWVWNRAYSTTPGSYGNVGFAVNAYDYCADNNTGGMTGMSMLALHLGAGTLSNTTALTFKFGNQTGAGDLLNNYGIKMQAYHRVSNVTNSYCIIFDAPNTGGTVTNDWLIYSNHEAPCRFIDDLQIADDSKYLKLGAGLDSGLAESGTYMLFDCDLQSAGSRYFQFDNGSLKIQEIASAPADTAGYGQLYCKDNAGTTELWFVDDSGTETQLA